MNTQLRCHKCDARNVVVVKREEFEREAGAPLVGAAGLVSTEVIELLLAAINVVLGWLQWMESRKAAGQDSGLVALCKSCGFWEKM